jgi:alpha-glucosidase (family GH31 glycosyl hydrolase)
VLPLGPVRQFVGQPSDEPMTLLVYPGADGAAAVYEDDGLSFDYRKGEAMRLDVGWRNRDRRLTVRLARGSRMLPPATRHFVLRVAGSETSRHVRFDGQPLEVRL